MSIKNTPLWLSRAVWTLAISAAGWAYTDVTARQDRGADQRNQIITDIAQIGVRIDHAERRIAMLEQRQWEAAR